jgi:hypothetical protein
MFSTLGELIMHFRHVAGLLLLVLIFAGSAPLNAHHSTSANFDESRVVEFEGEIVNVAWRNPHVRFSVRSSDDGGQETTWEVETNSVSGLRRKDITKGLLSPGDRVRIAGNPSRQGRSAVWANNLLLPSGDEVVLTPGGSARWTDALMGTTGPIFAMEGDASEPERGIFRVWSHTRATNMLFPETTDPNFDIFSYPLTDAAKAAIATFDPLTDNPTRNCVAKGMPTIMEQPYPMEILEAGGDIVLRLEEYDTVRTIHMNGEAAGNAPAKLGYSNGRWQDGTLVVETTAISWGFFDQAGIPVSAAVRTTEYFTPAADGSRLDYRMIVDDPATFTEPVELSKFWLYVPGVTVQAYACVDND